VTIPAHTVVTSRGYAKATFRKDRRLNIRLLSKDLEAIQKRALAEGLPYQTLIASLLHKYATGRLKEILTSGPSGLSGFRSNGHLELTPLAPRPASAASAAAG
jgi:hypothetical protein